MVVTAGPSNLTAAENYTSAQLANYERNLLELLNSDDGKNSLNSVGFDSLDAKAVTVSFKRNASTQFRALSAQKVREWLGEEVRVITLPDEYIQPAALQR